MGKAYYYFLFSAFSLFFFTSSSGTELLPVQYVYITFGLTVAILVPLFLTHNLDRPTIYWAAILFAFSVLSTYGSSVPSAFLYSIGPIFLLVLGSTGRIQLHSSSLRKIALFVCFLLIMAGVVALLTAQTNYHGRYYLKYVGNPNYTAILYLASFIAVQLLSPVLSNIQRRFFGIASWVLVISIVLLTETRSAALSLIVFIGFKYLFVSKVAIKRVLLISLIVVSMFGQLLAYYVFLVVEVNMYERSTFGIFDLSNFIRVQAFYHWFGVLVENPSFIWTGVGDVEGVWEINSSSGELGHVPHNWFVMMWLSNGLLFTGSLAMVLFHSAVRLPKGMLPPLAALIIVALVVGRAALAGPLCLVCMGGLIRLSYVLAQRRELPGERVSADIDRYTSVVQRTAAGYVPFYR